MDAAKTASRDRGMGTSENTTPNMTPCWDREYDVIVVGSGFAGVAAAIEARRAGARDVLVLEKMEALGGNSAVSAVPCNHLQAEQGIADSPALFMEDVLRAGHGLNNLDLVRALARDALAACRLVCSCGGKWTGVPVHSTGHSVPRTLRTANERGADILDPLMREAGRLEVVFRNRCCVERILCGDGERPVGVRVREGYDFRDRSCGTIRHYHFRCGLVMCTGGWARDKAFISLQRPAYGQLEATGHKGATAEGLQVLLAAHAVPVLLETYQLGPWGSPDEAEDGPAALFADYAFAYGIMISPVTGRRFVNELSDRRTQSGAQLLHVARDDRIRYPVAFCGSEGARASTALEAALGEGSVRRYENAESLARELELPGEALCAQIRRWNAFVDLGRDEDFGRCLERVPPLKPPYYAVRLWPKIHFCLGGVAIDAEARVLDMRTFRPLPGVYAAGETVGGLHGDDQLSGISILEALVFGRIAGRNAALDGAGV